MPLLPPSSKSLTYTSPSTPPHLTYLPLKPPARNELLVKTHFAAINPIDIQLWSSPLIGLIAGKKEKGIGRDYSGTVVSVGEGLEGKWSVGDEVFGMAFRVTGNGTFSEYVTVAATDPIARKPREWSFEQAAAVPLVVLTAFAVLEWLPKEDRRNGNGNGKRRVVVAGASGGTGMWCVQLAKKLFDCHVTAVCSGKNGDFVRRMGADEVVDYTSHDVAQTLLKSVEKDGKYDLYIDCVGGAEIFEHWTFLLHSYGAYVTIVGDKTSRTTVGGAMTYLTSPTQVFRYLLGFIRGPRYAVIEFKEKSEWLQKVATLAEEQEVEVVVQEVIKDVLKEGSDAWRRVFTLMEEGRVKGKIVVGID